jgi:hypothetical protein
MRFEWVREGPVAACGNHCREWVSASGDIAINTARLFTEFSAGRDLRGATMVLDSGGGMVGPGLALGRLIRRFGMTTTVGRTTKLPPAPDGGERATLSPRGVCASMCVYAFLGGARRNAPAEAGIYVHQIWPGTKREDAIADSYSAGELVRLQRELGAIAKYTIDMGGDIALFEAAMRIPPWEGPRPLNAEELRSMHLHDTDDAFASALPGLVAQAAVAAAQATEKVAAAVADRAWTTTDGGGKRGIARKYPITIEGEQIGSFELSLACGEVPGTYMAAYVETRNAPETASSERVRGVLVAAGKERAVLKIESSISAASELRTVARGPLSPTLVAGLAETEGRGLTVATQTSTNVRTVIRIGNSGFGASFGQTIAGCPK